MRTRFLAIIALLLPAASLLMSPQRAFAFNPNFLLSDTELTDAKSLTKHGIQDFLRARGGAIATKTFETPGSMVKSASEIIHGAATFYTISPKVLLAILQKEQSLITSRKPTVRQYDWATGFGVCDSCSKDDPVIQKFKGFYNQVNWTAKRIRESYLTDLDTTGRTISGWGPGITKSVDGMDLTPVNKATAVLYTYTPHIHGNKVFVQLWNEWFFRRFPDGSLLKETSTETYYLIQAGKKRKFRSLNVVVSSYDPRKALPTTAAELSVYPDAAPINFPNYSLLRSPEKVIYLTVDGAKRRILSPDVFRTLGFNPEEVQDASAEDIASYEDGVPISLSSAYPTGALLQSATTGGVVYVEDGTRHAIFTREILQSRFKGQKPNRVAQEEIDQYPEGDPVRFRDGELVTSTTDRTVYFISNGMKRSLPSRETFERLGFQWQNIVTTSQRVLDLHPVGEPLVFEASEEAAQ